MRLKRKTRPTHAFSESNTSTGLSIWHISPVIDGEMMLGGGAPQPLCGRVWLGGWHIDAGLDDKATLKASFVNSDFVCRSCVTLWNERTQ